MELFRWESSPWGQREILGLSWDLLYVFAAAAALFIVVHVLYKWAQGRGAAAGGHGGMGVAPAEATAERVPERVVRHSLGARLFHWVMAASIFVLLGTAFLPILGLKFPWVTAHWSAGIVLTLSVIYHIIHASFWQDLRAMWFERRDLVDAWRGLQRLLGRDAPPPGKPGKYPVANKLFHWVTTLMGLAAIGTGWLMMPRVDTPFWPRNPYFLEGTAKAVVYVTHGFAAVCFVSLVMGHIYFALRPEHREVTLSMIRGWVSRREYLAHHDPSRWRVPSAKDAMLSGSLGAAVGGSGVGGYHGGSLTRRGGRG